MTLQQGFQKKQNREYFKISHGNICKNVPEGTEGAFRVEVKDKKTGEVKVYYEISHSSVTAVLENVSFKDDKFGKSWSLYLKVNDKQIAVQINEANRICADFLKKLPNLKQGQVYIFTPYDFITKENKRAVGFSIKNSNGDKIQSYYHSYDEKTKSYNELHGYPPFPQNTEGFEAEDWKMFFNYTIMSKFLRPKSLEFLKNNFTKEFSIKNKEQEFEVDSGDSLPDFDSEEDIPF